METNRTGGEKSLLEFRPGRADTSFAGVEGPGMLMTDRSRPERPTQLSRVELIAVSALQALDTHSLPLSGGSRTPALDLSALPGLNRRQYVSLRYIQDKNPPGSLFFTE